jgi:hypothetical protein
MSNPIATINWTPATNGNCISQEIDYKKQSDSAWIAAGSVSPTTNTYSIPGLESNVFYDIRILSNCTVGGPSPSTVFTVISMYCPVVTLSATDTAVNYSFPNPGESITSVHIELLDSSNGIISFQNPALSSTISGSFTGLNQGTAYQIRLSINAGTTLKICPIQSITTTIPVCDPVTNLTAALSS